MSRLSLWVEVYRPSTLEGYVFKNKKIENKIREWIANPDKKLIPIPHLLFSGTPGVGKTAISRILVNELKVDKFDVLEINASRENNVDAVKNKIVNFCLTWANGDYKIVILDEFDGFGQIAQGILRGEIEKYSSSVRFIATANNQHKILPAIRSRLQEFHFDALDMESYIERMLEILNKENVKFVYEDVMPFVAQSYPDLRKGINLLEQHVSNGELQTLEDDSGSSLDYMPEVVELFKSNKMIQARKLLCSQARIEDYERIYQYLYRNVEIFSDQEAIQSEAIIHIAQGLRYHGLVADPEICLSATLCQLAKLH